MHFIGIIEIVSPSLYCTKRLVMASDKTELSDILMYGVDFKSRRIYFGKSLDTAEDDPGDFNGASVELAIRALHKMASDAPGRPIEIHMSSYGGDAYALLRLHDEILACPCQVKFFGGGAIMSAATWILACCDERHLYPNATIMVHDGSVFFDGKHTDVQIGAAEDKRLQEVLYDIYSSNSRMPKEFWREVCQRDLYLTAEEAIMLGLADKIVEPKKRGNLRKMRQSAQKKAPTEANMNRLVSKLYSRINKMNPPKITLNPIIKDAIDPTVIVDDVTATHGGEQAAIENKNGTNN